MKATTTAVFLALALPAVMATDHSGCYSYFMKKDGCVWSAADPNERCPQPLKHGQTNPAQQFVINPGVAKSKRSEDSLERRYDTTRPSFPVAGGNGICGFYNSTTELGVCLWSGPEQNNPTADTSGWLNGLKPDNCRKGVYVQRKNNPHSVQYVPVLDGCSFDTKEYDPGCYDIALTIQLFERFNPTADERRDGLLYGGLTWDFDSINGTHPQNAPI
ncbi:hypothetical protein PCANC_05627 [Puccinia coronata f. sp. avenae]|uniref:Secreted protein n=1 Tax=Puccinia coronata f. sp. avenae TaxID=200324 RepID=A0A2N5VJR9_9BASI|nr:hypothetical protein PCASD_01745 [Puccinia coronata f. sp. avenae]PLW54490.1 hypothetical protein PCANC_05627 [Puccinia coronata f. sp. avenae]